MNRCFFQISNPYIQDTFDAITSIFIRHLPDVNLYITVYSNNSITIKPISSTYSIPESANILIVLNPTLDESQIDPECLNYFTELNNRVLFEINNRTPNPVVVVLQMPPSNQPQVR